MAKIKKIGIADAPFRHEQMKIYDFMVEAFHPDEQHIPKIKRMYERSEINYRHSVFEDFALPYIERKIFQNGHSPFIRKRMELFFEEAPKLALKAIESCLHHENKDEITHLITVSCTGLSAPGMDVHLVELMGLRKNIHRTSVNFMGCYAAIHAIKMANAICAEQPKAQVLIVDVELCTLHFLDEFTWDNVASSLLFADGCGALLINNADQGDYKIKSFYSEIISQGSGDMAWHVDQKGFQMDLSAFVPKLVAENIGSVLNHALENAGLQKEQVRHWAIHPGGKKILKEVEKALNLDEKDLEVSRDILKNYGNMSSVTMLYLLDRFREKDSGYIFCAGFGPGLTLESMILEKC